MSADEFNLLSENVTEVDFLDPILVVPLPLEAGQPQKYRIVDGEHRFEQQRLMDAVTIKAIIADPERFDEATQKKQTVRMNMIKGSVNPKKLAMLVTDLIENHDVPYAEMAHELGFADPTELESIMASARSSLPSEEMKKEFDKVKDDIKTMDDLSLVLNRLFTKYGDTLPGHFMILDFGGKEHLWVRIPTKEFTRYKDRARECMSLGYTFDSVLGQMLMALNPAEYIATHKALLQEIDKPKTQESIDELLK